MGKRGAIPEAIHTRTLRLEELELLVEEADVRLCENNLWQTGFA
jgi:hypothetical protein